MQLQGGAFKVQAHVFCKGRSASPHPEHLQRLCNHIREDQEKVNISQAALQCFSGDVRNVNGCHRPDQSAAQGVVGAVEEPKSRANVQQNFACPPGSWLPTCNTAGWSSGWVFTGSCHILWMEVTHHLISLLPYTATEHHPVSPASIAMLAPKLNFSFRKGNTGLI